MEAASYISAPFATQILADLGATVTKVEPVGKGDPYRRFGARYGDSSLFFKATNQNKSSVFIDLKDEAGFAQFKHLLSEADVFISNWRPAVAPGLGLTEELVHTEFPQLVWVRVSGYGQTGPRADMPAYDSIIQARSGVLRLGEKPSQPIAILADKVSAMTAAQTASAALIQRASTGKGAICDVAMMDAMAYFNAPDIAAGHRFADGTVDESALAFLSANKPFATADSFIMLSPVSGRQMRNALGVIDQSDLWEELIAQAGGDGMYTGFANAMRAAMPTQTTAHWEAKFREADVPASAVMTIAEHMVDDQIAHNATYEDVDEQDLGVYRRPRHPALMNGAPCETDQLPSPRLA